MTLENQLKEINSEMVMGGMLNSSTHVALIGTAHIQKTIKLEVRLTMLEDTLRKLGENVDLISPVCGHGLIKESIYKK